MAIKTTIINETNNKFDSYELETYNNVFSLALQNASWNDEYSLTILFVGKEESSNIHKDNFDDNSPADVMTFPDGDENYETKLVNLGDLVVCPEVAKENAEKNCMQEKDELLLYCLHGLLHIIGYDDTNAEKREIMWQEQANVLDKFNIKLRESDKLIHPINSL